VVEIGGSLTRRPLRSLRCLLAEATGQINEQNCKHMPFRVKVQNVT